jgi:hypothetical protein
VLYIKLCGSNLSSAASVDMRITSIEANQVANGLVPGGLFLEEYIDQYVMDYRFAVWQ